MTYAILRLSHRIIRDKRITTHLALTARAFGSQQFFYSGDHDSNLEGSIVNICNEWGGSFSISHVENELRFIKEWKKTGKIIHLTMYGIELSDKIEEIRRDREGNFLIVVGGVKVAGAIFELADHNIAIGHQPHSEVAALAVFLDRRDEENVRLRKFTNAKIEIIPTEKGKQTKKIQEM